MQESPFTKEKTHKDAAPELTALADAVYTQEGKRATQTLYSWGKMSYADTIYAQEENQLHRHCIYSRGKMGYTDTVHTQEEK